MLIKNNSDEYIPIKIKQVWTEKICSKHIPPTRIYQGKEIAGIIFLELLATPH